MNDKVTLMSTRIAGLAESCRGMIVMLTIMQSEMLGQVAEVRQGEVMALKHVL